LVDAGKIKDGDAKNLAWLSWFLAWAFR
jgi:hypothetical protein